MENQTLPIERSEMLQDLKKVNQEVKMIVKKDDNLPQGVEPVAEVAAAPKEAAEAPAVEAVEELIRIGDQTFKTQADAFEYAEKLQNDSLIAESYSQGVREALHAQAGDRAPAPVAEEEDFDTQFYSNPKETLRRMKEEAKQEALAVIDARDKEERAWSKFSSLNPDLADSRIEVMRILQDNWEVLGKMVDEKRAMSILATKTRAYFDQIVERRKPRTELPNRQAQVVSPAGGAGPGVTPQRKDAAPLTMAQQLKSLRMRT